eukprot:scaffold300_cov144-Isochrysis_galbana.AAC.3
MTLDISNDIRYNKAASTLGVPYPIAIKGRYNTGAPTPTYGYFCYAIQPHADLLDAKGLPLLCLRSNGCHRYLRAAERLLLAAVEAHVAAPRVTLNFCALGGDHTDPNPPLQVLVRSCRGTEDAEREE